MTGKGSDFFFVCDQAYKLFGFMDSSEVLALKKQCQTITMCHLSVSMDDLINSSMNLGVLGRRFLDRSPIPTNFRVLSNLCDKWLNLVRRMRLDRIAWQRMNMWNSHTHSWFTATNLVRHTIPMDIPSLLSAFSHRKADDFWFSPDKTVW